MIDKITAKEWLNYERCEDKTFSIMGSSNVKCFADGCDGIYDAGDARGNDSGNYGSTNNPWNVGDNGNNNAVSDFYEFPVPGVEG